MSEYNISLMAHRLDNDLLLCEEFSKHESVPVAVYASGSSIVCSQLITRPILFMRILHLSVKTKVIGLNNVNAVQI